MKRLISTILIAICTVCAFSQSINISFTGKTIRGRHVDMDSIVIRNLTQGWTATLVAPDTSCSFDITAIKINSTMPAELSQNVPNPFYGTTEVNLALPQPDKVTMQALDMGGRVFANYNGNLTEGEHRFEISLASPQGYLLSATTSSGTSSVKMVNLGSGGANRISYLGQVEGKSLRDGDYDLTIGDALECIGYTTYCDSIYESELYTTTITESSDTECQLRFNLRSGVTVDEITECGRYTWIDGHTYTESDSTATYTLTNSIGCDSVVRLNQTVYPTYFINMPQIIACDSYEYNDTIFTNSVARVFHFQTIHGCDSTIVFNLGIIHTRTYETDTTVCDSYEWEGQTYSDDRTFSTTYQNIYGCDSIIAVNFHVNHSTETIDTREECSSLVWIDGNTYTESNSEATYTYIAENGCDSVVRLNLTITRIEYEFFASDCEEYIWDNYLYTSSGDYTRTFTAANGCDSVVTMHYTILGNSINDTIYICNNESYTWINGETYTIDDARYYSGGQYQYAFATYTYTNSYDCDSTIRMYLYFRSDNVIDIQRACDSFTWVDGNTYTESNNTATVTLTNQYGCDSVVHLNLTIEHADNTVHEVTASECPYYQMSNGEYFTESGDYLRTLQSSCGCDSIVLLHLTITSEDGLEGTFYDERDDRTYRTIQYGCQTWFAEDLLTTHYTNGNNASSGQGAGFCGNYSNNGYYDDWFAWGNNYGYCPSGWHLPSQSEWELLIDYMRIREEYTCDGSTSVAKAMVSDSGWASSDVECSPGYNQSANNFSGLGLNPAGMAYLGAVEKIYYGQPFERGEKAIYMAIGSLLIIQNNSSNITFVDVDTYPCYGFKIRCVKDN